MPEDKRKIVVLITKNANGDRSSVGLTVANAALSAGMQALVFLVSDGVEIGRSGAADKAQFEPFRPLADLIDSFIENGGVFAACGSCCQYRGMTNDLSQQTAQVSGVATLIQWLEEGATAITL
jgi:tRNA 2-thiouridine synthesizing protein D